MSTITNTVILRSKARYGKKAPPRPLGKILSLLPEAVSRSIRMAFQGRSVSAGTVPHWLAAMSDIRFVGFSGNRDTVLHFESPRLGDAAPELYEQREFEWSTRPDENDTGFDLLGDVLADVSKNDANSDRFDDSLLRHLVCFRQGINGVFQGIEFTGHRYTQAQPAILDERVVNTSLEFTSRIPKSERVRVVGMLDMIRASTQAFAIRLDDGLDVRGVMLGGEIGSWKHLLEKRVLILGKAVFRPSGRLLRVDAEEITEASADDKFFSKMPTSTHRKLDVREIVREQSHKRGVAAIIGKWPGNETDEVIAAALEELH